MVPVGIPWPQAAWFQQHVALANQVFASAGFAETRRFSLDELPYLLPLHLYVIPRTLALFLLGALAWRTGVARRPDQHRRCLIAIAVSGVTGGAALSMLDVAAGMGQTLLGLGVYAAQMGLSAWWLRHYRYGPLEWLWRTLMYGAMQPMCRTA